MTARSSASPSRAEGDLDALTKRFVESIDAALTAKEAELLEV